MAVNTPSAGANLNAVPAPTKQTIPTAYVDFTATATAGWAQQYLPELYEQEVDYPYPHYEPFTHFLEEDLVLEGLHLTLSAQYAADILPFLIFFAWRDLNASRCPAV